MRGKPAAARPMPTPITHAFVAAAVGKLATGRRKPRGFWTLLLVLGVLPDLDVLAFRLGIPYGSFWGHRGFFHSLTFAAGVSLLAALLAWPHFRQAFRSRWRLWLLLAAAMAVHPLLDMLTDGGLGVALLAPLDNTRRFFPWRPIEVAPIGLRHAISPWGLRVAIGELLWVWLPMGGLLAAVQAVRRLRRGRSTPAGPPDPSR